MEFNKLALKLYKRKLEIILLNIFPGFLIIELFFGTGLLHNNINNVSILILYILWGFSLSLIFNLLFSIPFKKYYEKISKKYSNTILIDFTKFLNENEGEETIEEDETKISIIYSGFIIIISYFIMYLLTLLVPYFIYIVNLIKFNNNIIIIIKHIIIDAIHNNIIKSIISFIIIRMVNPPLSYIIFKIYFYKKIKNMIKINKSSNKT